MRWKKAIVFEGDVAVSMDVPSEMAQKIFKHSSTVFFLQKIPSPKILPDLNMLYVPYFI